MRSLSAPALVLAMVLASASSARADATAFLGLSTTPINHSAQGFAIGFGFLIVGFEVEYSNAGEKHTFDDGDAPALRTGMINGLLQMPFPVARMQFYATAGGGLYRERLGSLQETSFASNVGGGVKISLVGPLRLRIDYRLFRLSGDPIYPRPQRWYAGLNLAF